MYKPKLIMTNAQGRQRLAKIEVRLQGGPKLFKPTSDPKILNMASIRGFSQA